MLIRSIPNSWFKFLLLLWFTTLLDWLSTCCLVLGGNAGAEWCWWLALDAFISSSYSMSPINSPPFGKLVSAAPFSNEEFSWSESLEESPELINTNLKSLDSVWSNFSRCFLLLEEFLEFAAEFGATTFERVPPEEVFSPVVAIALDLTWPGAGVAKWERRRRETLDKKNPTCTLVHSDPTNSEKVLHEMCYLWSWNLRSV